MQQTKSRWYLVIGYLAVIIQLSSLTLAANFALADTTTPVQTEPHLIISAVQTTGGTNHTQEDFIEIYNPTNNDIDLKNYRLVKRTSTATIDSLIKSWTSTEIIPKHRFYLWANSSFSGITVIPNSVSTATIADNNGVALRLGSNDTGAIIDSITWGNTLNGFENGNFIAPINPTANQSVSIVDLFDQSKGVQIISSNPRNSSTEFLPPTPIIPPVTDPLVTEPIPGSVIVPIPTPAPIPIVTPPTQESSPAPIPETIPSTEPPAPVVEPQVPQVVITEILPNPSGEDSGAEQIELYNNGPDPIDLSNFVLDDVSPTETLTSNAFVLPSQELPSKTYLVIIIPNGNFAMNNSGGDVVTLFDSQKKPLDTVVYSDDAPEGKTYAKFQDNWNWANSTLGAENGDGIISEEDTNITPTNTDEIIEQSQNPYDESGLQISEIYPDPKSGEKEFIEILNSGEEIADLSKVNLWVGDKHKLLPNVLLPADQYYVVESGLPAQLRNSGQTLKLTEDTNIINSVNYNKAIKGSSYSRFEDEFQWTLAVTKGTVNKLELPEPIIKVAKENRKQASKPQTKAVTTNKTATKISTTKTTSKTNAKISSKTNTNRASLSKTSNDSANPITNTANNNKTNSSTNSNINLSNIPTSKKNDSVGKLLAMGAAAVTAGVTALYKLVFTKTIG